MKLYFLENTVESAKTTQLLDLWRIIEKLLINNKMINHYSISLCTLIDDMFYSQSTIFLRISKLGFIILSPLLLYANMSLADDLKFDPFAPSVKKVEIIKNTVSNKEPVKPKTKEKWTAKLLSIIEAGSDSMANVDGNIVVLGDSYKKYTLIKISKTTAVFEKGKQKITLELEE